MFRFTILACLIITFLYVILNRQSIFAEHFLDIDNIYIMPAGSSMCARYDANSVVINQGNTALGLPFEFFVENPHVSVKELHEIAREILPQDSSQNYVLLK